MKTLRLREGKERAALRRHPWIYDNAIAKGGGDSGETVRSVLLGLAMHLAVHLRGHCHCTHRRIPTLLFALLLES
jgi:hypothetical protein